jgi:hypothetical protein
MRQNPSQNIFPAKMIRRAIFSKENDQFESGTWGQFVPLNEEWGVKFYFVRYWCDYTYRLQRLAYEQKLAPAVGRRFSFKKEGKRLWGYITEKVLPLYKDPNYKGGIWQHEIEETLPEFKKLMNDIHKIVPLLCGIHWGNVGWTKDRRLVIIDFTEFKNE